MKNIDNNALQTILENQFGFKTFRPGQLEAISTLLTQKKLLCILPTGHGKSLLYQLPAVLLEGLVVVISPLIALMRDQLTQLKERFNIAAASINSDQTESENNAARVAAMNGHIKILFIAPEQIDHVDRFDFLLNLKISLIVVDEAHCISTWGHDFRPSYRQISHLIKTLNKKISDLKILGLTATANFQVENDIKKQFLNGPEEITTYRESMDRPNIKLSVLNANSMAEKLALLDLLIKELPGVGLIYCATQENTEIVSDYLQIRGLSAASYHAGYPPDKKRQLQQDFLNNKFKIIAATNALGMGIDKSDLRFIIHFDVPGSITAYYQEVGRCGRDGLPAQGILIYNSSDKKIQNYFIVSALPNATHFQRILESLENSNHPLKLMHIKQLTGMHPTLVNVTLAELIEQDFIEKLSKNGSQVYLKTKKYGIPDLKRYETQYVVRTRELKNMLYYAEQKQHCLMQFLRNTLGDVQANKCGHCSICSPQKLILPNPNTLASINHWLANKGCVIRAIPSLNIASGISILDGKLRNNDFIYFMKHRANNQNNNLGLTQELYQLIEMHLSNLMTHQQFGSIIVIPSRTWHARESIANFIAKKLNVPVLLNYLSWKKLPLARQGELLNNDQRRENVNKLMQSDESVILPSGTILLLDDYTGSGATLIEATTTLRKNANIKNLIIPFTIAAVKWRLGAQGMV
ncbi:MAG: RecQ family ATP-dependent DNA helicase [Gammaproteobacteria bacterium]